MISQDCLSRKSRKEWSHCGAAKGSGSYPINRVVGQQCGSQQVLSIVVVLHTSQHLLSIVVFHCNFPLVHRRVLIVLTEPSPLIGCTRNHEQHYHPVQHCYPTFTVLFLFCCFFYVLHIRPVQSCQNVYLTITVFLYADLYLNRHTVIRFSISSLYLFSGLLLIV